MISARTNRKRQSREAYRAFSKLTKDERAEVLADSTYKRFALRIKADDWQFAKTPKGWVTKR